ncbi:methyltransferase domain-containing protein [Aeribacillus pallidus]|uniref:putative RNA methyltransferase n=1 Tax=Aeribacillus TaxID=1055323 RepID=UPI0007B4EDE4|nr:MULTISPECIES: methyltransferase domain-containing protein [Aeribacillus]KZM54072.1 SAM-dependent methyltransferase [Aeribacillus pallidus]MED0650977.1 methyltransferase domain-containing protein [Aeribacillus composti]MED4488141.1 methyltransferase domain-containing protein [Aeribacillus pallidus]
MTKKIKSAELVSEFVAAFRCPLCKSSMRVVDLKSLICSKNHTFDFTKQGYVNLMTRSSTSHYKKELFEARRKIIMESDLYTFVHEAIATSIKEYMDVSFKPLMVADVGCGEGSHLQRILDECKVSAMTGVGLDISKEGIAMAAKRYENQIWMVGDLATSPLADQSFHVILNILSPANYKEFKRILVEDGLVIKVIPRPHYLKELRDELFDHNEKKFYKNDQTVSLFKKHLHLLDVQHLCYTKNLNKADLKHLVQMTPLAWSADKGRIDAFINRDSAEIMVDLEILVGVKKTSATRMGAANHGKSID